MTPRTGQLDRRGFLGLTAAAGAAALAPGAWARAGPPPQAGSPVDQAAASADACIFIYLPGGIAQTDTWDPKVYTPYRQGMMGSDVLGTCESIPTAAEGIRLGEGLPAIASVMDKGCILRTLAGGVMFGAVHLRAQHYFITGYVHPAGFKAPSLGAIIARARGRRHEHVPEYIYIGRDLDTSDSEKQFIHEYLGPGFLGPDLAPFMIPDPTDGLATLSVTPGLTVERLDRRRDLLRRLLDASASLEGSDKARRYEKMLDDARAMMDSPVKAAFDYANEESADTIAAYEPAVAPADLLDSSYFYGRRFGHGLLLARRLVERGARFIQVEYQYGPFKGFDMHESGQRRMAEMKRQFDAPIAQLIRDLHQRGLLERTLVVIGTEFGRTIASAPSAGQEPEGSAESHTGEDLVVESEKMYGFHGHFSSCSCMLFFGGGFRGGFALGRTADRHPMLAVEHPVKLIDAHATIYHAMGIPPDHANVTEGRPVYVTKDAEGQVVPELLA
jgi:hypothetical protein